MDAKILTMSTNQELKEKAELEKINAEIGKIKTEKEKLEAEKNDIKRIFLSKYQFWAAIAPIVVAAATLFILEKSNVFDANEKLLKADTLILEAKKDSLNARIAAQSKVIYSLQMDSAKLSEKNSKLFREYDRMKRALTIDRITLQGNKTTIELYNLEIKHRLKERTALINENDSLRSVNVAVNKNLADTKDVLGYRVKREQQERNLSNTHLRDDLTACKSKVTELNNKIDKLEKQVKDCGNKNN